jgi:hypothetical protein
MAQRALNSYGLQPAIASSLCRDADDGVGLEESNRHCWIVEVDSPVTDRLQRGRRQRLAVDLQSDTQRRSG